MRTIISTSGSRCQQYFLLFSLFWWRPGLERSSILSEAGQSEQTSPSLTLACFHWRGRRRGGGLRKDPWLMKRSSESTEEEKKSSRNQVWTPVCFKIQVLLISRYVWHIFHVGPCCGRQRSAGIYGASEPPSWRGDAEAGRLCPAPPSAFFLTTVWNVVKEFLLLDKFGAFRASKVAPGVGGGAERVRKGLLGKLKSHLSGAAEPPEEAEKPPLMWADRSSKSPNRDEVGEVTSAANFRFAANFLSPFSSIKAPVKHSASKNNQNRPKTKTWAAGGQKKGRKNAFCPRVEVKGASGSGHQGAVKPGRQGGCSWCFFFFGGGVNVPKPQEWSRFRFSHQWKSSQSHSSARAD